MVFPRGKYPAYGNLVPRDIATREIFDVCVNQKLGINGENMVYLDLSHKDPKELDIKLGGIIEIYEKFMGDDPRKLPMKIFPAVHYSMGGLWVDYDQMTNIRDCLRLGNVITLCTAATVWEQTPAFCDLRRNGGRTECSEICKRFGIFSRRHVFLFIRRSRQKEEENGLRL